MSTTVLLAQQVHRLVTLLHTPDQARILHKVDIWLVRQLSDRIKVTPFLGSNNKSEQLQKRLVCFGFIHYVLKFQDLSCLGIKFGL